MTASTRAAILVAADSPEKLRACDAWRVLEMAAELGVVSEVKAVLQKANPAAFAAVLECEAEDGAV
jgi:hypothetical protein